MTPKNDTTGKIIAPGITLTVPLNTKNDPLIFSIDHSRWDRLNAAYFPTVIAGLALFFFLAFLYGGIVSIQNTVINNEPLNDIVYFEAAMFAVITLCFLWIRKKLLKIPKSEILTVTHENTCIVLKNSTFKVLTYDLKDIHGAWLYEYLINGTLMSVYIILSKTAESKKAKDNSPHVLLPVHLATSKKLEAIYRVILLYIRSHFPEITVGYDDAATWNILKKFLY